MRLQHCVSYMLLQYYLNAQQSNDWCHATFALSASFFAQILDDLCCAKKGPQRSLLRASI